MATHLLPNAMAIYITSPQCHSTYLVTNITATHKPAPYNVMFLGCDLSPLLCVVLPG